jgi:oligopeptide/dipeptide ABC transporter ATP-binding protein
MNERYDDIIFQVNDIEKKFILTNRHFYGFKKDTREVYAVNKVNLQIKKGEVLGIIGESGCGKTTFARIISSLIKEDAGTLIYKNKNISKMSRDEQKKLKKCIQIIFQDPYEYLNPTMQIRDIIAEPLIINNIEKNKEAIDKKIIELLNDIELKPPEQFLYRYPHELSGGQRQRVAIARALVLNPEFIVADEPTSMLDVSVRAGILNILLSLKQKFGITIVLITHDITTAAYMCDRIAVMYKGRIVEVGKKEEIIFNPSHPYTKALVGVVSDLRKFLDNMELYIKDGEINPYVKTKCCSFSDRCVCCNDQCHNEEPILKQIGDEHFVACNSV